MRSMWILQTARQFTFSSAFEIKKLPGRHVNDVFVGHVICTVGVAAHLHRFLSVCLLWSLGQSSGVRQRENGGRFPDFEQNFLNWKWFCCVEKTSNSKVFKNSFAPPAFVAFLVGCYPTEPERLAAKMAFCLFTICLSVQFSCFKRPSCATQCLGCCGHLNQSASSLKRLSPHNRFVRKSITCFIATK